MCFVEDGNQNAGHGRCCIRMPPGCLNKDTPFAISDSRPCQRHCVEWSLGTSQYQLRHLKTNLRYAQNAVNIYARTYICIYVSIYLYIYVYSTSSHNKLRISTNRNQVQCITCDFGLAQISYSRELKQHGSWLHRMAIYHNRSQACW